MDKSIKSYAEDDERGLKRQYRTLNILVDYVLRREQYAQTFSGSSWHQIEETTTFLTKQDCNEP